MKSLLARLLLVVSIALVPVLSFQAYTESQARRVRHLLVEDEALRLMRLVSAEQQQIAEGAEQALNAISASPAVQDNLPELCPRQLANLLAQSPRYTFAGVIGLNGHFVCGSSPFDRSIGVADRAYFRDALQTGGFVIGDYAVGRASGQKSVHMAKPFRDRDGIIAGVVVLALDLDWLRQQLERLGLPPDIAVSVRDRNGTMLARFPDGARYVGQPMPEAMRFSLAGDAIRVDPMQGADGRPRIVAYAPVGTALRGLRISVGLDRDISFAAVTQANRTGLLLIAAGAGLALALAALLGQGLIRRPLDRLLAVADRWRSGDLAARTGLRADGSEFGRLAAAFDRMAAAQEARENTLRTALESTTDSVVVLDRCWRITFLNQHAQAMLPGCDLVGQLLWDARPGLAQTIFGDACRTAMDSGVPIHLEAYHEPRKAQFELHAYPSAESLTLFFRDVTNERAVAARLAAREQMVHVVHALGEATPDLLYAKDRLGRTLYANPATLAVLGCTAEAALGHTAAEFLADPALAEAIMTDDRRIMARGETETIEEHVLDARLGKTRVWQTNKTPLRHRDTGEVIGIAGISRDVTEERRTAAALAAERARLEDIEARLRRLTGALELRVREEVAARQRQDLLMAELDHRVKNMLATIQALVSQSRTSSDTLDGFLETFEGRLRAMGRAHNLLTNSRWEGANLEMLVTEELAPFISGAVPAVEISADAPVLLKPKAALAFSLAVHELATNAAKYGALSVPGGRVQVGWHAEQRDGQVLVLHWREAGGPEVVQPGRRGFGLTLIENSLAYELGGTVQVGFPAAGLTCTMVVPWDQIASLAEPPPSAPSRTQAGTDYMVAALGGKRILVVEDNALLAATIVRNLTAVGVSVVGPVARLEAAVELAETAEIDIALLDVDLDGTMVWPAADRLVRRDIPFVFASGYQASLVMPRRFEGAPVLNKPFSVRELRGALLRPLVAPRFRPGEN